MAAEATLHVVPVDDLIEHDVSGEPCVCGDTLELFVGTAGATGSMRTHFSLDGREFGERGEDMPLEAF